MHITYCSCCTPCKGQQNIILYVLMYVLHVRTSCTRTTACAHWLYAVCMPPSTYIYGCICILLNLGIQILTYVCLLYVVVHIMLSPQYVCMHTVKSGYNLPCSSPPNLHTNTYICSLCMVVHIHECCHPNTYAYSEIWIICPTLVHQTCIHQGLIELIHTYVRTYVYVHTVPCNPFSLLTSPIHQNLLMPIVDDCRHFTVCMYVHVHIVSILYVCIIQYVHMHVLHMYHIMRIPSIVYFPSKETGNHCCMGQLPKG